MAVSGVSMAPTYLPGDFLVVRRSARLRPGDVVVVRRPGGEPLLLVKRCRRVEPEGGVWVEGDNAAARDVADDSRTFGVVPPELVVGRVVGRYWPVRRSVV